MKQVGVHLLKGKIDEFSFYFNKHWGWLMRRVDDNRKRKIKKYPSFERFRQQSARIQRASHISCAVRRAFNSPIHHSKDDQWWSRLMKAALELVKTRGRTAAGPQTVKGR